MERYNDDELLYLMRCGNEEAKLILYDLYYHQVSLWVLPFYSSNYYDLEYEDLVQLAMMTFSNAIDSYRDDQNASFYTFIKLVVTRKIFSVLRMSEKRKSYYQFEHISLDDYLGEDEQMRYEEIIASSHEIFQPDIHLKVKEQEQEYRIFSKQHASLLECIVYNLRKQGYSYEEISKKLHIPLRSVYNANYRYHKKLLSTIDTSK